MDRSIVSKAVLSLAPEFQTLGATSAYIFGSQARGDHHSKSDLDIFIDFDPQAKIPSLLSIIGIEQELSETLGIPVRITTRRSLHPKLKQAIESEAVKVF